MLRDLQRQGDAVAVSQADGLHTLEFSRQGVQAQAGFKGFGAQLRHARIGATANLCD